MLPPTPLWAPGLGRHQTPSSTVQGPDHGEGQGPGGLSQAQSQPCLSLGRQTGECFPVVRAGGLHGSRPTWLQTEPSSGLGLHICQVSNSSCTWGMLLGPPGTHGQRGRGQRHCIPAPGPRGEQPDPALPGQPLGSLPGNCHSKAIISPPIFSISREGAAAGGRAEREGGVIDAQSRRQGQAQGDICKSAAERVSRAPRHRPSAQTRRAPTLGHPRGLQRTATRRSRARPARSRKTLGSDAQHSPWGTWLTDLGTCISVACMAGKGSITRCPQWRSVSAPGFPQQPRGSQGPHEGQHMGYPKVPLAFRPCIALKGALARTAAKPGAGTQGIRIARPRLGSIQGPGSCHAVWGLTYPSPTLARSSPHPQKGPSYSSHSVRAQALRTPGFSPWQPLPVPPAEGLNVGTDTHVCGHMHPHPHRQQSLQQPPAHGGGLGLCLPGLCSPHPHAGSVPVCQALLCSWWGALPASDGAELLLYRASEQLFPPPLSPFPRIPAWHQFPSLPSRDRASLLGTCFCLA